MNLSEYEPFQVSGFKCDICHYEGQGLFYFLGNFQVALECPQCHATRVGVPDGTAIDDPYEYPDLAEHQFECKAIKKPDDEGDLP